MAEVILSEPVSQDKQTVVTVTFYGTELVTIKVGDGVFVAMRPVVEGLGLSWSSQAQKLNQNKDKYGCVVINTPSAGGAQEALCIPLRKLNGWLFSVNPMKVKREIREKLIRYQEECFAALYSYWHNGIAVNPNAIPDAPTGPTLSGTITPSQQQEIKELVQAKVSAYPENVKRKVFGQIWTRLQRKFKVPRYEELPVAVFGEARDYLIAMQVRGVDVPALPTGEQNTTIRDYASIFRSLPQVKADFWRDLSQRNLLAHERFQQEMGKIKEDALRPFKENRRIEVATFMDFATLDAYKRLFDVAEKGEHTSYMGVYGALLGLESLHDMLMHG